MMKEAEVMSEEIAESPSARAGDRRVAGFAFFAAALALVFSVRLVGLIRHALDEELHSHILLIPLVAVYLASLRREELPSDLSRSWFAAAGLGFLAIVIYLVPVLTGWFTAWSHNDQLAVSTTAFVLSLAGGGFAILGKEWMRQLAFPVAFLLFLIPIPDGVVINLETVLMRLSAMTAEFLFHMTNTPVFRAGQVMELPGITLQVARECSGIRSTLVLIITSLIASYMFLGSSLHRGLLVALVIPLGILRNAFRVLVLGLLCVHLGPEMIDSWIHHQGGPVFFGISLVPLFVVAACLRQRERRQKFAAGESAVQNPKAKG